MGKWILPRGMKRKDMRRPEYIEKMSSLPSLPSYGCKTERAWQDWKAKAALRATWTPSSTGLRPFRSGGGQHTHRARGERQGANSRRIDSRQRWGWADIDGHQDYGRSYCLRCRIDHGFQCHQLRHLQTHFL